MKWFVRILLIVVVALVIAVCCGVPALNWIAWFFDFLKTIFSTLADWCRWLQKLVNWGVIKK